MRPRRLRCFALAYVLFWGTSCGVQMPPLPAVPAWNELPSAASIDDDERQLWEKASQYRAELEKEGLLVADESLSRYLNGILASLVIDPLPPQAPTPTAYVVRGAQRNALSAPDGAVVLTTSMLASLQNEAQLAALLGHELGHFLARHALLEERFEKISRSMVERMQLSRDNETYCDRFAFRVMQRAGYDPHEMLAGLQLVEPEDVRWARHGDVFRSHPFTSERIRDVQKELKHAPEVNGRTGTEPYNEAIVAVLPIAVEVELKAGVLDRADASISRLLTLRPDSGRGYYLKAEHARRTAPEGRRSAAARADYERAVALAPDDPDAVRAVGLLYYEDGEVTRAAVLFQKYLNLAPTAADRAIIERYLGSGGT